MRASATLSWRDGRFERTATATIELCGHDVALVDAATFRPIDRVDIALDRAGWHLSPLVRPRDGVDRHVTATAEPKLVLVRLRDSLGRQDRHDLDEIFGCDDLLGALDDTVGGGMDW